jgi:hypothetical protein
MIAGDCIEEPEPAEVLTGLSGSMFGLVWGTRKRSQQLKARKLGKHVCIATVAFGSGLLSSSCKALATSGGVRPRQDGGRR